MPKIKDIKIIKKKHIWLPILKEFITFSIGIVRGNPNRMRKDKRFKLIYIKLKEISAILDEY